MSKPIESYGLIGDCETAALVGSDGSIDWLCWPRFDSDSTFAALLGENDHGRWLIAPAGQFKLKSRSYQGDSLILETSFSCRSGDVTLVDFMPPRDNNSDIVRLVRCTRGKVRMKMELSIRFGYGAITPWVRRVDDEDGEFLLAIGGPDMVTLRTPVTVTGEDHHSAASFEVSAGETVPFVLTHGTSYGATPKMIDPEAMLKDTQNLWDDWTARSQVPESWRTRLSEKVNAAVTRSLVTLKALTYEPTGGIVAAPTTSLPERIGGERNWDYRFCWLRDATITLLAMMDAGHYGEAEKWRDWLLRAVAGNPDQIQIMYGIAGERRLNEWTAAWLPGYAQSSPVRIGNAAHGQLQLDVFGEMMDALYQGRCGGLPENDAAWALQKALIEHLESIWAKPDAGIWEIRGEPQHFTYSKVMAWVAVDRCIRSAEEFGMSGPVADWRKLRDAIHEDVCAKGFDPELGSFVQAYGSKTLDASLLLLPTLGFLPASDARFVGTVAAIEKDLMVDGFVRRYDTGTTDDGLGSEEGAFLACSFWLADAYAMLDRNADAWALFDRLLDVRNELGLLAEEYDAATGHQVGNFPQAFSHVALINTAKRLAGIATDEERTPAAAQADG